MATNERSKAAKISWEGDSLEVLREWPEGIRTDYGLSLREMQEGRPPRLTVRPMKSIRSGVFELKDYDDKTLYRMIYLAKINDVIYVLHCFEKDSKKTDKRDLKIASQRLAEVQRRLREEQKHGKLKDNR